VSLHWITVLGFWTCKVLTKDKGEKKEISQIGNQNHRNDFSSFCSLVMSFINRYGAETVCYTTALSAYQFTMEICLLQQTHARAHTHTSRARLTSFFFSLILLSIRNIKTEIKLGTIYLSRANYEGISESECSISFSELITVCTSMSNWTYPWSQAKEDQYSQLISEARNQDWSPSITVF